MAEFKAGDKVYFPMRTTKVHLLVETTGMNYVLGFQFTENTFTLKGQWHFSDHVPAIFHATEENRELLEKLYGVEFEAAPPKTFKVTIEVPATFIPEHGETYWYINYGSLNGTSYAVNCGNVLNDLVISRGVWRTEKEALIAAETIFNLKLGT